MDGPCNVVGRSGSTVGRRHRVENPSNAMSDKGSMEDPKLNEGHLAPLGHVVVECPHCSPTSHRIP